MVETRYDPETGMNIAKNAKHAFAIFSFTQFSPFSHFVQICELFVHCLHIAHVHIWNRYVGYFVCYFVVRAAL